MISVYPGRKRSAKGSGMHAAMPKHLVLKGGLLGALLALAIGCSPKSIPVDPIPSMPASLVVPATQSQPEVARSVAHLAATPQSMPSPTATVPETLAEAFAPAPATEVPTPEPEAPTLYTVEAGDTLLGIAMAFDVPMAALQLANDLGATTLVQLGQSLVIPAAQDWAEASPFWVVYEVGAGETLGEIAALNGIDLVGLLAVNGDVNADNIAVGQAVILPLRGPQELAAKAIATAAEPAQPTATMELVAAVQSEPIGAAPTTAPTVAPVAPAVPADVAGLPAEILRLINVERAAYGLPSLTWDETLARAAQRHADDCYARGWCSHTGSDGSTYKERIIREGYEPVRWSECWAWYGSADRAVAMWMDEVAPNDPHRRTILNDALTEVGVGVVPGNGFGYYFIADFGTPR